MASWRQAYRETYERLLAQSLTDREVGRKIMTWEGRWIDSCDLTWHDLSDLARQRARASCERAIRRNKEPAIEL